MLILCGVLLLGFFIGRETFSPRVRAEPVRFAPPTLHGLPSDAEKIERGSAERPTRLPAVGSVESVAAEHPPAPRTDVDGASPGAVAAAQTTVQVGTKALAPAPVRLRAPLWEPTQADAPWYFKGAQGGTSRARAHLEMRKNCGYQQRDSPLATLGTAERPVLSGTAWHHGPGNCPARCALHGTCTPSGRCDCAPYHWGADCSIPVITQRICVYNDSSPWFCDKPACVESRGERASAAGVSTACVGNPLAGCPMKCSGRGMCVGGSCSCNEGFGGQACEKPIEYGPEYGASKSGCLAQCSGHGECERGFCRCTPPYWGADCAMGPSGGPRCRKRPCVYVYELPARMNVLGLKAEPFWRQQMKGHKFDYRTPPLVHEALLRSAHRTSDAAEADLFYVPTWDFHGSWGNPEVYYRAHRYITTVHPFWNASGGADHLWTIARDAAACATPWGSLKEELQSSIILSNWGGVTGLSGAEEERCFRPDWDIVLPGTLKSEVVERSPWLLSPDARAAQLAGRTTQLFFFGALCWKTDYIVRGWDFKQLRAKCDRSYSQPGFLARCKSPPRPFPTVRFRGEPHAWVATR